MKSVNVRGDSGHVVCCRLGYGSTGANNLAQLGEFHKQGLRQLDQLLVPPVSVLESCVPRSPPFFLVAQRLPSVFLALVFVLIVPCQLDAGGNLLHLLESESHVRLVDQDPRIWPVLSRTRISFSVVDITRAKVQKVVLDVRIPHHPLAGVPMMDRGRPIHLFGLKDAFRAEYPANAFLRF